MPDTELPPHPKYGKPLSGHPKTVDGVTFRPYSAGILQYVRISDDFRIEVWAPSNKSTVSVVVDGAPLGKRFRLERVAYAAGVALAKKTSAPAPETVDNEAAAA